MGALLGKILASKWGRRVLAALVAAGALYGAYQYVGYLHARIDAEKSAREAVEADLERAEEDLEAAQSELNLVLANAESIRRLLEAEKSREREQDQSIETIVKEVYRDRPPTPEQCRAVLAPISSALDGLRQLQGGDETGAP